MRRPAAHHQHHHIFKVHLKKTNKKKVVVVVVAENTYAIVQEKNENVLFEYTLGKGRGETRDSCRISNVL